MSAALTLANEIEAFGADLGHCRAWAAELRRQHAEIERLRAELVAERADKEVWIRRADKTWHEAHAVAKERERCAKLCEAQGPELLRWWGDGPSQANAACQECAVAIRQNP